MDHLKIEKQVKEAAYLKLLGIGGAPDEPEQLLGDPAQEGFLGRQERERSIPKTEAHLESKSRSLEDFKEERKTQNASNPPPPQKKPQKNCEGQDF